jgi:hypothetical protein
LRARHVNPNIVECSLPAISTLARTDIFTYVAATFKA